MKMLIIDILKGFLYGVFSISPGLSGGFLAIYFGDYEKCLDIFTLKKVDKSSFIYLFNILFGFIVGVILFSNIITFLYDKYINSFKFYVLIINIILILYMMKKYSLIQNIKIMLISVILLTLLNNFYILNISGLSGSRLYCISGVIYSITKIIPGISSTTLLINMGFYDNLMSLFSNPLLAIKQELLLWTIFVTSFFIASIILLIIYSKIKYKINLEKIVIVIMLINIFIMLI